jgi:hypothetical protein
MKKQEKRYPLSEKPLHYAGQSLDEEFTVIRLTKILLLVLFVFILVQVLGECE